MPFKISIYHMCWQSSRVEILSKKSFQNVYNTCWAQFWNYWERQWTRRIPRHRKLWKTSFQMPSCPSWLTGRANSWGQRWGLPLTRLIRTRRRRWIRALCPSLDPAFWRLSVIPSWGLPLLLKNRTLLYKLWYRVWFRLLVRRLGSSKSRRKLKIWQNLYTFIVFFLVLGDKAFFSFVRKQEETETSFFKSVFLV